MAVRMIKVGVLLQALLVSVASGIYSPVIMVPGDGGSQLYATLNKTSTPHLICSSKSSLYNLWLNLESLVPIAFDCFVDNIILHYNRTTRKTRNTDGVEITVPGFGEPRTVEYLDPSDYKVTKYFADIASMLRDEGYVNNVSLRAAPYDFRKGPNELGDFFVNLKQLIEETSKANGYQRVVLISHSLGSLLLLHFLQAQKQSWKDKYVRMFVPIAGPWGGAVKAVKVFCTGDNFDSYIVSNVKMKSIEITLPSSVWLLPTTTFWRDDEVLVSSPTRNYTLKDYQALFNDLEYPDGWEMFKDLQPFKLTNKPPGVEVYCLYSRTKLNTTVERIMYKTDKLTKETSPVFGKGAGDDTVNLKSLEGCQRWQSQQKQLVRYKMYENVDHLFILRHQPLIEDLRRLLNEI